jgi:hypothetical protein
MRELDFTTTRILMGVLVESLILIAFVTILFARGWTVRRLGLTFSWRAALAGVPLFIIYLLLYWITATVVLLPFPAARSMALFRITTHAPFAVVLLFIVVNSFFEELTATAYVIEALSGKGARVAITASTLLRLVYHLVQGPVASLSILPLGLLFGSLYWQRRNVWPLVVAHTIANVVIFAVNR